MSTSTFEIVRGISQALANKHDGATDEKGKPVEIGLRREKPTPHTERRMMDGFDAKVSGRTLRLNYHSEISIKEVHKSTFEQEIIDVMESCLSYLKKEYKAATTNTLKVKKIDEHVINVSHMNSFRSWVQAYCLYELSGIEDNKEELADNWQDRLGKPFKDYVDLGKDD